MDDDGGSTAMPSSAHEMLILPMNRHEAEWDGMGTSSAAEFGTFRRRVRHRNAGTGQVGAGTCQEWNEQAKAIQEWNEKVRAFGRKAMVASVPRGAAADGRSASTRPFEGPAGTRQTGQQYAGRVWLSVFHDRRFMTSSSWLLGDDGKHERGFRWGGERNARHQTQRPLSFDRPLTCSKMPKTRADAHSPTSQGH